MATQKLTKAAVEALKPAQARYLVWDTEITGLGVRVLPRGLKHPKGGKVALFRYRLKGAGRKGAARWYTIGHIGPGLTVAKAREIAEGLRADVVKGGDPARDTKAAVLAVIEGDKLAKERTFKTLADSWLRTKSKLRSYGQFVRIVNSSLGPLHKKAVVALAPAELESLIGEIEHGDKAKKRKAAPVMASQVLGVLRRILAHGIKKRWIAESPATFIEVDHGMPVGGRDRVLSDDELVQILGAADEMGYPYGRAIEFLMLTAARRTEAIEADWGEFDFDQKLWRLPAERSKNGLAHEIHLSPQVVEVLASLPDVVDGEFPRAGFLFSNDGKKPIRGLSNYKRRLDVQSGVQGWRLHDVRRSVATALREMGVSQDVTERILNHKGARTGIAAIYDKSVLMEPRKQAVLAWGERIEALVAGREPNGNVVDITGYRAG